MRTRYVKVMKFTVSDLRNMEQAVNNMVAKITEYGGKVVTIINHTFRLSPMYLIYTIVYEADAPMKGAEEVNDKRKK